MRHPPTVWVAVPPQAYGIGAVLVWNHRRDMAGKITLSQWGRAHPFLFIGFLGWFIPHVLIGSHLIDRLARVLKRHR